ncbi:FG-GAP repeat protein [Pyxidicoccus parkwayensis]|uniref:FG-GAP repeat protein n=1 Tax=Pyxidicoccus parkwayensis TaxID=2813578 RepID=A0ABX7PAZ9_9BACT|nr:FG-GAP-like repeat-containing protein [Pyxidicoccus parkwaysis]QSQ27655.1 FG-GAP repeat protein [Pyxidicoccus parkwaysis]
MASEPETLGSALSFEKFVAQAYQEPDTGLYIVDGDTPARDVDELRALYESYRRQRSGLAVNTASGADTRWSSAEQRNLTYCVSTGFGSNYSAVVSAMASAAAAWQGAANVRFVHRGDQDGACTASNTNVVFDVGLVSGQPYLARAFFPHYARNDSNLLIDSSAFGNISPYSLAGVLRHELGHVLGFRHEQTRPEAGTCFEDNDWRALTPYDSASVMHYPWCNGTNTGDLLLSAYDRQGAADLYGAPTASGGSVVLSTALTTTVSDLTWQIGGVGDFNQDGVPDILWRNDSTGANGIWYMGGTDGATQVSNASIPIVSDLNWRMGGAGDFNQDGVPDILWRNDSTGANGIWYMGGTDGATQVSNAAIPTVSDPSWKIGGVGDFNRDGVPDILWRNDSTGANGIWYMGGTDGATQVSIAATTAVSDLNWRVGGVGDFNQDAVPDILWRNDSTGANGIWYMGGTDGATQVSNAATTTMSDLNWRMGGVGDFNHDGVPDILWRHQTTGENYIWYMGD